MPIPLDAPEVLNREFLEIRARLLQVGASLDRIGRAADDVDADPRMAQILEALGVLANGDSGRAERIQLLFSRDYDPDWRNRFKLAIKGSSS